jgi:hypothetical protein
MRQHASQLAAGRNMKPRHTALIVALLGLAVAGGDRAQSVPGTSHDAHGPAFAAGQILNLDPAGKFSPAQHASDVGTILGAAASQSSAGLVEMPSPVSGGGVMVNLEGRFQQAMTMTIDADGKVSAPCVPAADSRSTTSEKVK